MQPRGAGKRQRCVSLIDLGEIGAFDSEPDPPSPPPPRWMARLGVPGGRKAAAFAAVAFFAGGLAGTAPATLPEPAIRVLTDVTTQSSLFVVDDTLVGVGGDTMVLTATDLPTGAIRWSAMIGQPVYLLEGVAGTVAVQTGPTPGFEVVVPSRENMGRAMAHGKLTVLDARTGMERWRHAGALLGPYAAEGALVMMVPSENVTGEFSKWFLVGVDRRDGHDVWTEPLPDGTQWTIRYADERAARIDPTTVTIAAPDGAVSVIDTASGRRTPMGRLPAGSVIDWSWQDLLGVRRPDPYAAQGGADEPSPDGVDHRPKRFEVYQLPGLDAPLWGRPVPEETTPVPCQTHILCLPGAGGQGTDRIDVRTGAVAALTDDFADLYIPGALGLWQIQGGIPFGRGDGHGGTDTIAFVSPGASRTDDGWLGVVTLRRPPQILPLIRIPLSVDACWPSTDRWVVCPGVAGTIVVRQSDLAAMIAAIRPGRPS